jgi:hypothetical protein
MDGFILITALLMAVILIIVVHYDGVMVGEERSYNTYRDLPCVQCRMQEGSSTINTHEFYNHEER